MCIKLERETFLPMGIVADPICCPFPLSSSFDYCCYN